ncbi:MAG: hemolysin family protein [Candidatus Cloacimonetes bacterium]|nr:hemolysin family protein [Candidatus Cloacimonadota bacterium]
MIAQVNVVAPTSFKLAGMLICLCLSAFFSGSETAFFSLSKIQLKKIEKRRKASSRRILRLLRQPRMLLITILLGNTVVNIAAASLGALITLDIGLKLFPQDVNLQELLLVPQIILMTVLLLIMGEITPKLVAFAHAEGIAGFSGFFLEILKYLLWPLIKLLELISLVFSRSEKLSAEVDASITSEDFRHLIESKTANHPLEEHEKTIIANIFRLPKTQASEIMIPRVDMVAVDIQDGMDELQRVIVDSGHSRIPVFSKTIDNIIGFVYAKDLILSAETLRIDRHLRRPVFVTENMSIQKLLNFFKASKIHVAIVVDEYGGTSGLVALEDVLEEVFGEILDEHDNEALRIERISPTEYTLSGMFGIAELNQQFDLNLDDDTYDNIAEFLLDHFNRMPELDERFTWEDRAVFTVADIEKNRINFVKLTLLATEDDDED